MQIEQRLEELGLTLPELVGSPGNYVRSVQTGQLLFLSGTLSYDTVGKVGADVSEEEAYAAARDTALYAIAVMKHELGDLSKVKRFVKLVGFVNAAPDFTKQALVMNGASDLFVEVFGEDIGAHARTAIGAILPRGCAIELDIVLEVEA